MTEGPPETVYEVAWSRYGRGVADLIVKWKIADPSMSALPDPESLYFDFPMESRLRGGTILLVSPRGTHQIRVRKPDVHFIGGGFHYESVTLRDPAVLARLARGGPWRFIAVDGRGRLAAEGPLNLPPWEELEGRFAALKPTLDKDFAAHDSACRAFPIDEEQI